VYLLVGLAGGLALGFLAALLAERFDGRVRSGQQLADATGTSTVLDVSRGGPRREAAYAAVHASLLFGRDGLRAVMLVAATPEDRLEEVARGLAQAAAVSAEDVLVLQSGPSPAAAQSPAIVVQAAPAGRYAK